MPAHQSFSWRFKSDGPAGGDAFLHASAQKRYSCQDNSYTIEDYFGITVRLSADGKRFEGECRDVVSGIGGGCRIHGVRR